MGALAAWAFGGLTQDVIGHDEAARVDPHVLTWVLAHRTGWLTAVTREVTWTGSTAVLMPVLLTVAVVLIVRRHDWRSSALLSLALGGAIALYDLVKTSVGPVRPPSSVWIGHFTGASFPSGHATQSIAFFGMLVIVVSAGRSARSRGLLWTGASLVVLVVGASRIYLGGHWMSDVLGGWSLGVAWLSVLLAIHLWTSAQGRGGRRRPAVEGDAAQAGRSSEESAA